jgi:hypothetical protein
MKKPLEVFQIGAVFYRTKIYLKNTFLSSEGVLSTLINKRNCSSL